MNSLIMKQLSASTNKELTEELIKRHEQKKLIQCLVGLDRTIFGTIPSNFLRETPLPTVNQAYSKLIQEEKV